MSRKGRIGEWDRTGPRWGKVRRRVQRAFLVHSELTTSDLIERVYPRGLRSKTWYLGRIARLFADPVERRWPEGNVWRAKPDLEGG